MEAEGFDAKPSVLEREFNLRYFGKKSVTLHGVRRWLLGETIPSEDKLEVLKDWLGLDASELNLGKVSRGTLKDDRGTWKNPSPQEQEAIDAFLSLSAPDKKVVRDVILALVRK
jgi:hypothetical protein